MLVLLNLSSSEGAKYFYHSVYNFCFHYALTSGCPFSQTDKDEIKHSNVFEALHKNGLLSKPFKNGECLKTNGGRVTSPNTNNICNAYLSTKATLQEVMPKENDTFALADIYGKAIRLAFHDAAEFDKSASDLSGPDGCLSYSFNNKGLIEPTSLVNTFIEPLWQSVCDHISRADFWALFAKLMAEEAALPGKMNIPFSFGRQDSGSCSDFNRLPNAQKGFSEIVDLFVTRMGLALADGVVLQGSHSVGHVHQNVSGYFLENSGTYTPIDPSTDVTVNAWDTTPAVLDNNYFISMFIIGWASVKVHASNGKLNIWGALTGPVIALNTDMAVGFLIDTHPPHFGADIAGNNSNPQDIGQVCQQSSADFPEVDNFIPCRSIDAFIGFYPCLYGCTKYQTPFSYVGFNSTKPSTFKQVMSYTQSNNLFLKDYALAFSRMINVGYGTSPSSPGKLGYLTDIDLNSCQLPLCQFAGGCLKSSDCVLGNKCVITSKYYSQCVADPTTYFTIAGCVRNFAEKCTSSADCCDPGAYCDVSNSYPQCKQPVSSTGRCVDTFSPTPRPSKSPATSKPSFQKPSNTPSKKPTTTSSTKPTTTTTIPSTKPTARKPTTPISRMPTAKSLL